MKKDGTIKKKRKPPSAELLFGHGVGHLSDDRKVLQDSSWLGRNEANCLLIQVDVIIWNDRTKMSSVHCQHFVWCGWYLSPFSNEKILSSKLQNSQDQSSKYISGTYTDVQSGHHFPGFSTLHMQCHGSWVSQLTAGRHSHQLSLHILLIVHDSQIKPVQVAIFISHSQHQIHGIFDYI